MTETMEKLRRQRAIRAVIGEHPVASQQDLSRLLARRGFDVAQGTLSRDLKELRILRVPAGDGYRYREAGDALDASGESARGAHAGRLRSVAALEVTAVDANETCVVVRTLAGRAQGVAVVLDALAVEDVLATVAGDDTILVIPSSVKRTSRLATRLSEAFGLTPRRRGAVSSR